MKGITVNENMIEIDPTYAKVVKAGKGYRVESKEAQDLDSWPTFVGDYDTKAEALAVIANGGYVLVPSWQVALRLEGWTQPWPRTTLV